VNPLQMKRLLAAIAKIYPSDPMMQELRLIRTLHAIEGGFASSDEAIREFESG
jgi:hypothetical protein